MDKTNIDKTKQMQCKNLRDVSVNVPQFPAKRIYRGGSIDYLTIKDIWYPRTILNLRKQPDNETQFHNESLEHRPAFFQIAKERDLESYDVQEKETYKWILSVIKLFEAESVQYPVLIHCASGKDRTGVIVMCLLLICGIDRRYIEIDFASSIGISSEHQTMMKLAIDHITKKGISTYFRGIKLSKIQQNLMATN